MTIINTVAAALNGTPQPTTAIAEALGLELTQVAPALTALKHRGEALRQKDGWIAGAGEPDKPEPQRSMRKTKPTAAVPPPEPDAPDRTLEFALSESGAILMRAADHSWEWIAMSLADMDALRRLINRA